MFSKIGERSAIGRAEWLPAPVHAWKGYAASRILSLPNQKADQRWRNKWEIDGEDKAETRVRCPQGRVNSREGPASGKNIFHHGAEWREFVCRSDDANIGRDRTRDIEGSLQKCSAIQTYEGFVSAHPRTLAAGKNEGGNTRIGGHGAIIHRSRLTLGDSEERPAAVQTKISPGAFSIENCDPLSGASGWSPRPTACRLSTG